jgi:hypothetical protein
VKGGHIDQKIVQIPAVVVSKANLKQSKIQTLLKTYPDIAKLMR